MKIVKRIFILLIFIVVVLTFLELIPVAPKYKDENTWVKAEDARPLIIPHGGAKELYPENTVYAFEQMLEKGYDVFEIDLTLTADDQLITHHDINVERLTGVKDVKIRDYTYEHLKGYNYGYNFTEDDVTYPYRDADAAELEKLIPANLEDLFKDPKYKDIKYILEIKDTVINSGEETFILAVEKLLTLIEQYHMEERVIVSSFDDEVIKVFKEKEKDVMTSTASNESLKFVLLNLLNIDFFYSPTDGALLLPIEDEIRGKQRNAIEKLPPFMRNKVAVYDDEQDKYYTNIVNQKMVDEAHRHNMAIMYWTVNDEATMRKLIDLGVDGIITDQPELLKSILDEIYPESE